MVSRRGRPVGLEQRVVGRTRLEGLADDAFVGFRVTHRVRETPVGGDVADGPIRLADDAVEPGRVVAAAEAHRASTGTVLAWCVGFDLPEVGDGTGDGAGGLGVAPLGLVALPTSTNIEGGADVARAVVGTLHPDLVSLGRVVAERLDDAPVRVRTSAGEAAVRPTELCLAEVTGVVGGQQFVCLPAWREAKTSRSGVVEGVGDAGRLEVEFVEESQLGVVEVGHRSAAVGVRSGVVDPLLPVGQVEQGARRRARTRCRPGRRR